MAVSVGVWNALNAFGEKSRAEAAMEHFLGMDVDVGLFPEAYDTVIEGYKAVFKDSVASLKEHGYRTFSVDYDDPKHYEMVHGFLAVSRLPAQGRTVRFGERNSIALTLKDPDTQRRLRIVGLHLDYLVESRRVTAVKELGSYLGKTRDLVIVGGDFNAVHGELAVSRLFNSPVFRWTIDHLPPVQARSQLKALADMSIGTTMASLEALELIDADPTCQPTMTARLPLAQLDHVMYSKGLEATDFARHNSSNASDHRSISATFR